MPKTQATVNIDTLAKVLGIARSTAYAAARENALPCPVFKINGRFVVPMKPLADALGISLDELRQMITPISAA